MKRFYKLVSIDKTGGGYHILLDGKPVKTKSGAYLCAANEAIATRIMTEWAEQKEHILPDTMPFTQILNTKIDRVSKEREEMSKYVLKYMDTDLICYFADNPPELLDKQKQAWQIWLDWFEKEFGIALETTTGLAALTQDSCAHEAAADFVHALDDEHFTILQLVTSISGSVILGLAMIKGTANAAQVFDACFVEESFREALYDAEKYGADPALEKEQKAKMRDFNAAHDYIALL